MRDSQQSLDLTEEQIELLDQKGVVEALLFAAPEPIAASRIASATNLSRGAIEAIIEELNADYGDTGRSFRIENIAGGYRLLTLPRYERYILKANMRQRTAHLSHAALEALAVIAYKQPVTRGDIERIRGVDCGGILKNLMAKELIVIDGRSPAPGRPIVYSTSEFFLEFFGLPSIEHLPPLAEIQDRSAALPTLKLVRAAERDGDNGDHLDRLEIADDPADSSAVADTSQGVHDEPVAEGK